MHESVKFSGWRRNSALVCMGSLLALVLVSGCSRTESDADESEGGAATGSLAGHPVILTTFYPVKYFCERILGDNAEGIEVRCPLPEDADAIFWQPSRAEIGEFQAADLIIINGAGFEKWVQTTALPESRLVNTAEPFAANFLQFETTTHSHGMTGGHTHEGIDGHTWLDPLNAKIQAGVILRVLADKYPDQAAVFQLNFEALVVDLDALDRRFAALTPRLESCRLFAAHPAYNYLAARYGWSITNLALDPASKLSAEELAWFADAFLDAGEGKRILLWEGEPLSEESAVLRARFGLESVVFGPAELRSAAERRAGVDYLGMMRANLVRLEAAVE